MTVSLPADVAGPCALSVRGLRKVFGGTVALAGADLALHAGEIHGLLGENGAGKSTLIKTLAGLHEPDDGVMELNGRPLRAVREERDDDGGLAFIHQHLGLVDTLSVGENIAMELGYAKRGPFIDWKAVRAQAKEALDVLDVDLDPACPIDALPVSERAMVAIARAVGKRASVLVLDEPTASLAAGEVRRLFAVLRRLRDHGLAIVFVSHRLDEVREICDRATILRDGRTVATVTLAETTDAEFVGHIVGRAGTASGIRRADVIDPRPRLTVRQLMAFGLGPVSLDAHEGEVLAVSGLSDSGHLSLGGLLSGIEHAAQGAMTLDGRPYAPRGVADASRRGVAYLPADRIQAGVAPHLTVRENLFLNPSSHGWLSSRLRRPSAERRDAHRLLEAYDVRPREPDREVATLSGGNAQKVLLARVLMGEPSLIVVNEPTTGVDIGARESIHRILRERAANGATVVVITSDFEEAANVADRTMVLCRGRLSAELRGEGQTPNAIGAAALQRPPALIGGQPEGASHVESR